MQEMNPSIQSARLTIRDIAELAGVSIATVSRVVNGRGEVSSETRNVVERVVREHGYSPNRSARRLSSGRTGLVGVTLPLIAPAYFSAIVAGAAQALYERDLRVVLCPTEHQHDREVSLLERLMHGTADGGLLVLPEESAEELRTLRNHGYRFVVIDPLTPVAEEIAVVSAAHSAGAYQGVRHLTSLGHHRIGAITGPAGWVATEERLRGYHSALAGAGIQPDPELVTEANFEIEGGRDAATRLLERSNPPTAIFAFNDNLAIGALQAARARGLRLPEQLSVVGFDDTGEASIVTPALTTLRQPLAEMGRMAVSLLGRLLDDEHLEALHVELATKLVVRESTAAPGVRR
jgi:LacI family transcriptional regulator